MIEVNLDHFLQSVVCLELGTSIKITTPEPEPEPNDGFDYQFDFEFDQ